MKVLMPAFHYYPVIGGIETWTQKIAEGLSQKAEITVVTGKVKNQPTKEEKNGVKIYRTSLFALSNLSKSPLVYTLSLVPFIFFKSLSLMSKEKIDILHCQGFLSSLVGFCLHVATGISYITTVQRLEKKNNPLKNFIYRKAVLCIAASLAIKKNFEDIGVKNIEVIPNGIDLKRFENLDRQQSRQELELGDEFVVMTVARLEKVKGIEYLIKALHSLRPDLLLLIIGDGSERKYLEKLVAKINLKEKVKFLGEIPNKEIPRYLAAADCFCLPSLREGFGIAVLESQAAGVPVIGSRVGGILDLIEDEKSGILVAPAQPTAISQAISRIYSNPEFAQNLVKNAKINLDRYNWQNISLKVLGVYKNLASREPCNSY